ncbi:hypothetical protein C8Q78DRAFT_1060857 [Trametes maxima]|nr:hypothetical protein C8Q78DRAFT_1060857 [Trametes maxima]
MSREGPGSTLVLSAFFFLRGWAYWPKLAMDTVTLRFRLGMVLCSKVGRSEAEGLCTLAKARVFLTKWLLRSVGSGDAIQRLHGHVC